MEGKKTKNDETKFWKRRLSKAGVVCLPFTIAWGGFGLVRSSNEWLLPEFGFEVVDLLGEGLVLFHLVIQFPLHPPLGRLLCTKVFLQLRHLISRRPRLPSKFVGLNRQTTSKKNRTAQNKVSALRTRTQYGNGIASPMKTVSA